MSSVRRFTFGPSVSFHPIVKVLIMHVWQYAYRMSRVSGWKQDYLDRKRFQKRIKKTESIIAPILTVEHRLKIYNRFISTCKN